ncbi:GIY-YIG nuclease family protein [Sphingobacterium siyangense]|uniref:Uncharacterized protein n=1 Tax=Sphingobacterium siyangense TaxID=459529 RepID=A0A562MT01_9SPHI|nr:GIY-YIG nuclease family protein [Sphingobacterium siyangense]TWI22979.1 hypothetical protein IQ31_01180 [Sphingobacterium siyangense]
MNKVDKKQLKSEFLESKPLMGVLTIYNRAENKIHIADSLNLTALSNRIRFMLNMGQFDNKNLQADWNRLGEGNFLFENAVIIPFENDKITAYKKVVLHAATELKSKVSETTSIY